MAPTLIDWPLSMLATTGNFKVVILLVGLAVLALGLVMAFYQRKNLDSNSTDGLTDAETKFERRKFGRRMAVARLIVCLGVVMASCYWVHERLAFAVLLGMMLLLLVCITILAYVDLASVGLKLSLERMAENEREVDKAVEKAIADHHRNRSSDEPDHTSNPPNQK